MMAMRIKKWGATFLAMVLMLSILLGWGTVNASAADNAGQFEQNATVNAEDFYGCWEYFDYDIWVYIYGDGTYQMFNEYGVTSSGSYYMDGVELYLRNSDLFFALDGEGYMIDSDGDELFQSVLPDFITVEDFYGCWEYDSTYDWICVYSDGTFEWHDLDGIQVMSSYYLEEGALHLNDTAVVLYLDGSDRLVDNFGDGMFRSELPQG